MVLCASAAAPPLSFAQSAPPALPTIWLQTSACDALDPQALTAILALESSRPIVEHLVPPPPQEESAPYVALVCATSPKGHTATLNVLRANAKETPPEILLSRAITLPADKALAARVVALALVELVETSSHLAPPPVVAPPSDPPPQQPPVWSPWSVGVFGLVGSADAVFSGGFRVVLEHRPLDWLVYGLDAEMLLSAQDSDRGSIDLSRFSSGARLGWAADTGDAWSWRVFGGARLGSVSFAGSDIEASDVIGQDLTLLWSGGLLGGSALWTLTHGLHARLDLETGYTWLPAAGRVDGRRQVAAEGAWITAGLGLGWAW